MEVKGVEVEGWRRWRLRGCSLGLRPKRWRLRLRECSLRLNLRGGGGG